MIIECPICEAKVNAELVAEHNGYIEECPYPYQVCLLECPVCKNILVGGQYDPNEDGHWEFDKRLWPSPSIEFNYEIPWIVKVSLKEARKCYKAKAYSACAVMCGRALEGICKEQKTKSKTLFGGLKELLDRKVIDERLFKWSEILREKRNLGAHPSEEGVTKDDALDLLDFVIAICDYVYVLSNKYEKFIERQKLYKELKNDIPF